MLLIIIQIRKYINKLRNPYHIIYDRLKRMKKVN